MSERLFYEVSVLTRQMVACAGERMGCRMVIFSLAAMAYLQMCMALGETTLCVQRG